MKVRTNYSGTDYIIPGKLYDVIDESDSRRLGIALVYLEDAEENDPDRISLDRPCAHLNCEDTWEIVEENI